MPSGAARACNLAADGDGYKKVAHVGHLAGLVERQFR